MKEHFKSLNNEKRKELYSVIQIIRNAGGEMVLFSKGFMGADISLTIFGNNLETLKALQQKGILKYKSGKQVSKLDEDDVKLRARFDYQSRHTLFDIMQDPCGREIDKYYKDHKKYEWCDEVFKITQ